MEQSAALEMLRDVLAPERLTHLVDVGANPIGSAPPYRAMLDAGLCRVTGFEPQPAALEALNRAKGPLETYLPWVLGDGGAQTLKVCRHSGLTSTLPPDPLVLETFTLLKADAQVLEEMPVRSRRLDDLAELEPIDFLKLDVQGGELAVLCHGRERLRQAVVVQTEISFATLYQGQAGCGEIDRELRAQGFLPFCFEGIKVYDLSPVTIDHRQLAGAKQLLEADLVYVRNYFAPEALDAAQLKQLCLIMHCCYRAYDLCMTCLLRLQKLGHVSAAGLQRYVDLLVAIGALRQ